MSEIPDSALSELRAQVLADDGTVRYCPSCYLIGPLGWCSCRGGVESGASGYTRRVDAPADSGTINFVSGDGERSAYAYFKPAGADS